MSYQTTKAVFLIIDYYSELIVATFGTCKFFSIAMSPYIWTYDICTLVDSLLFDIYHYYYFKHWRRATWAGCCFHSIVTFSSYSIFLLLVFPFVFFEILTTWLIAKYLNIIHSAIKSNVQTRYQLSFFSVLYQWSFKMVTFFYYG